ncbi:MAG: minor capsid protein, partial [Bacillales bacterium]
MANDFRELPPENYDEEIAALLALYIKAIREIEAELLRLDLTTITRAQTVILQKKITTIISDLDVKTAQWIEASIPKAVDDGIIRATISLGNAETVEQAREVLKVNNMNRRLISVAIADTQDDLLQVTQNVSRKVRTTVRQVTAEAMRSNIGGMQATDSLKREIMGELKKRLGDSLNTGIID